MAFRTILTAYGLSRLAQAVATGTPIALTHMAIGDGNGNPVTPTEGQTQLARETYRHTVNRVYQDPEDPRRFTCELIVPADVGGFTVRELGVFDIDGGLFAVANVPDTYKPLASEGAFSDGVVRLTFIATNASVVTLQVDPNVAVATQTWIINNITPAALIPGGTTDQVLAKASNADGDFKWSDINDINVTVDCIEDRQTLAASQTIVNLVTTTTRGLAVYIEGVRIPRGSGADEWQPNGASNTSIVLGKAYPAGTRILCTQNEPTGSAPAPLERSQNLADVPNKATARTNLDVFSKAETRQMAPAGEVAYFAADTAPAGWLKANGAAVSRTTYSELYSRVGIRFGAGDGFNTFNLPDLRGEFIRGWDDGRGVDSGRPLGGFQGSQNLSHTHSINDPGHSHGTAASSREGDSWSNFTHGAGTDSANLSTTHSWTGISVNSSGGNEARPRNIALLACIKY